MIDFNEFDSLLRRRERMSVQLVRVQDTCPDLARLAYGLYRNLLGFNAVSSGDGHPFDRTADTFFYNESMSFYKESIMAEVNGDPRKALIAAGDLALIAISIGASAHIPAANNDGKDWYQLQEEVQSAVEYGFDPDDYEANLRSYEDRLDQWTKLCLGNLFSTPVYLSSVHLRIIVEKLRAISHSATLQEVAELSNVIDIIDQWGNVSDLVKLLECLGKINSQFNLTRQVRTKVAPVVGMTYGNEIENLYPEEFALDNDAFDLGYIEESLMQTKSGTIPKGTGGDFICLIDYSGSTNNMMWDNDKRTEFSVLTYERAVAMSIACQLKKMRRRVHLAGYSSSHRDHIIHPHQFGSSPKEFIGLMSESAGGTEYYDRALDHAVKVIKNNGRFRDADILLITDGQSYVGKHWLNSFLAIKDELSITVHSLIVGDPYEAYSSNTQATLHYFSDSVTNVSDWQETTAIEGMFSQLRHDTTA